ncbi:MAG: hypothetical protein FRX48_01219 [Lasallia pustulata]|uniref:Thioredoxin-like fold n=1 Tax=Lasallia pustulata TaxID=136370 RepID=A0A5M8PZG7_9LECA|nr:MAG: hypothetical protein FRX48_01219 [Lasallia pustulata]
MASGTTNGATAPATNGIFPKITLYTNHGCPWAQRAHIVLKELQLPYEEVIIDLDVPRPDWYLKINPRGLVPSLKYNNDVIDETLIESGIVSHFLADSFPSHLLPASHASPHAPLQRAKIAFFVETYFSKVQPLMMGVMQTEDAEAKEKKAGDMLAMLEKEIEPLLKDAKPFFGGNERMTMAEALTAPFVLRLSAFASDGVLLPASLPKHMAKLPSLSRWMEAVRAQESVTYTYNERDVIERTKRKLANMRKQG